MWIVVSLNKESTYQFEYEPPGELVTTKRVIPIACDKAKNFTTINPKNGRTKNFVSKKTKN